jgi:CRISPR-associated protein Csm3
MSSNQEFPALVEKVVLEGTIRTLTGLHIGGNEAGLGIGGADKIVVRRGAGNEPYIPGSSLKGKIRSLLEKATCARGEPCRGFKAREPEKLKWGPCSCSEEPCEVCLVFGIPASEDRKTEPGKPSAGASRLLVRDAHLRNAEELRSWPNLDMPYTEVKTEVAIDRLTSQANPRQFERVPAGAVFGFTLVLNVFRNDPKESLLALVEQGLRLVAHDGLGGQSSRGYGAVEIAIERRAAIPVEAYRDEDDLRKALENGKLGEPLILGGFDATDAA